MISIQPALQPRLSQRRLLLLATLGAICSVATLEQIIIASLNGWWADELFALWASDRNTDFVELFRARIATDSNPPLYFSLLHVARLVIDEDRTAVIILNVAVLLTGTTAAFAIGRRLRDQGWITLCVGLFVLGGPIAAYLPEARTYCLAITASFVAVLLVAYTVLNTNLRYGCTPFIMIGLIAGLSHVYAALLCCALAVALVVLDIVSGSCRLLRPAFALTASALASSAVWMIIWFRLGPGTLGQVSWIPFTAASVWESGRGALNLTYGDCSIGIGSTLLVMTGLIYPSSRRLSLLVAVSVLLFIAVPIVISYRVPIILTRYWLVGSPLLVAPLALLIACWRAELALPKAVIPLAVSLIAIFLPLSFWAAAKFVAAKPVWRGYEIVKAELSSCENEAVHVLGFTPGFSILSGVPESTFVDVRTLSASKRLDDKACPVLGWSEHYVLRFGPDYVARATSEDLLALLKLAYTPAEVLIDRHSTGFVVTRRP